MNPLRAIWRRLRAGRIPAGYLAHRRRLLAPPTSDLILDLEGVRRAARDLSGDPNDLRMFGLETDQWYHLGIRMLGRSAVEMTRDPLAKFMARSVARSLDVSGHRIDLVIDPFVGTGNLLFHCLAETSAGRGIGIDSSPAILALTRSNFACIPDARAPEKRPRIDWLEGDWNDGLDRTAACCPDSSALVVVCPPWGDAYTHRGLDLRRTTPPIVEILRRIARTRTGGTTHALIQTIPRVDPDSIRDIEDHFRLLPAVRPENRELGRRVDYLLVRLN